MSKRTKILNLMLWVYLLLLPAPFVVLPLLLSDAPHGSEAETTGLTLVLGVPIFIALVWGWRELYGYYLLSRHYDKLHLSHVPLLVRI